MHLHSFFVLTRFPAYVSLALNYFPNKMLFSDNAKIIGGGRFSSKVPAGGRLYKKGRRCTKKVGDHWFKRTKIEAELLSVSGEMSGEHLNS